MLKINLFIKFFALTVIVLSWSGGAMAEVRYVSDQLVITLRAGQGDQYRILRTITSGTRLEILEDQGEFSRARLDSGEEGWVRTQYLVDAPAARLLLNDATEKLGRYELENKKLRQELGQLKQEHQALQQQSDGLIKENRRLADENGRISQVAAQPLELSRDNQQLKQAAEVMASELATLRAESGELKAAAKQQWFMAGGGMLLFGVLLGVVLPKLRIRRQQGWS